MTRTLVNALSNVIMKGTITHKNLRLRKAFGLKHRMELYHSVN